MHDPKDERILILKGILFDYQDVISLPDIDRGMEALDSLSVSLTPQKEITKNLLCRILGHDDNMTFPPDPRPREYHPNGRAVLRKAYMVLVCERCGRQKAFNDK